VLQQAQGGDRSAFEQLLQRYRPDLCRMVDLRMDQKLRSRMDPSDVVQEAQLEAFRRLTEGLPLPKSGATGSLLPVSDAECGSRRDGRTARAASADDSGAEILPQRSARRKPDESTCPSARGVLARN
jgi:DNA-directed RNA polymerase specialized sigma24 family protein